MKRQSHEPRGGYRSATRPSDPRFTVITVRPSEYAEPPWVNRVAEVLRRWRASLQRPGR